MFELSATKGGALLIEIYPDVKTYEARADELARDKWVVTCKPVARPAPQGAFRNKYATRKLAEELGRIEEPFKEESECCFLDESKAKRWSFKLLMARLMSWLSVAGEGCVLALLHPPRAKSSGRNCLTGRSITARLFMARTKE